MKLVASLVNQFNHRIYDESIWRIERVLSLTSEKNIWYSPNDATNSIGHLILHLCGNVTQWIGSGIGGHEDLRERDNEFSTTSKFTKSQLLERLHALRTITDKALATLVNDEELLQEKSVQGFQETVLSIVIHVIEHFSYHTGQIALISKYLEGRDLGFYEDFDLNVKN